MGSANRASLIAGDVLELTHDHGVSYVAYVGRHEDIGEAIWVIPQIFPARPPDLCTVFEQGGFNIFYSVKRAVKAGMAIKVGHCANAVHPVPTLMRFLLEHDTDGYVTQSYLSADGFHCTPVGVPTAEQLAIPVAEVWSHSVLLERSASGWTPARLQRPRDDSP